LGSSQTDKPARVPAGITVAVDGLGCNESGQGSFTASAFAIDAKTTSGTGGAGAGKTVFTDLAIAKPSDSCSVPLLLLAAGGRIANRVTLTDGARGDGSALTMVLENVQVVSSSLNGSNGSSAAEEMLDLSYSAITITDAAGHTTGRIVRETGSVPFSPLARQRPEFQI
jgi:type VI protein secretion system component Hcp